MSSANDRVLWVVLRFENEYDQHGGYFVGVFASNDECQSPNGHFGRKDAENTWYEISRIEIGKHYVAESSIHLVKEPLGDDEDTTIEARVALSDLRKNQ